MRYILPWLLMALSAACGLSPAHNEMEQKIADELDWAHREVAKIDSFLRNKEALLSDVREMEAQGQFLERMVPAQPNTERFVLKLKQVAGRSDVLIEVSLDEVIDRGSHQEIVLSVAAEGSLEDISSFVTRAHYYSRAAVWRETERTSQSAGFKVSIFAVPLIGEIELL